MSDVCVLLANGFEEIEATTIIDVLRRAEVSVTTLGVEGREVRGAHDITIQADALLSDSADRDWEMVVLPGGMPGAATLRDHAGVQKLITAQQSRGGKLAAICAAPIALGAAGVLQGKQATSYPGFEDGLLGAQVVERAVVSDGLVTTSRGPGTAMQFALALVADLKGASKADELKSAMLVSA